MSKLDKMVPGSYKDNADYQEKGYHRASAKDQAFSDTRVLDLDYPYTNLEYPGGINPDAKLTQDMAKHKIHKPGR